MNKKIFRMGLRLSIVPLILLISMTTVVTFAQAEEYLAPVITSISPDSGEQGQGLDLTISGYNFMEGVEVTFHPPEGIIVESVDFTDAQSVTTFIVIDIDALAGPRDVTVISPDGQGYTLDQGFTVTEAKPIIDVTPPPMITGLTATDAHDGNISLSWIPSDVEDFAFHAIYISETEITDVTGLSPIAKITDIAVRTYQVTELVGDTRYYVAVTAVDTVGNEGKAVTSVSATPTKTPVIDVTPPPAITGLTATDAHDGKVDLMWIPSTAKDFAYYTIYVAETEVTDVTGLSSIAKITDIAVGTYQVTELVDGTRYYFAVTAVDTVGNEGKAVTSVSATPTKRVRGELLNGQYTIDPEAKTITFTVTWTGDPSETVYVTVSDIDYPMEYSDVGQTLTVTRTFEELNLKPGDAFEFSFKAAGEEGMEKGTGETPEEEKIFPWWVVGLVGGLIALTTLVIMRLKKKKPAVPVKKKPPKEKKKKGTPYYIQVKRCNVFSEPDELMGKVLQTVTYNETVWVADFDEDETFQKVITANGIVGWVPTSHLIPDKRPIMQGKVAPGKASTSDEPGSGVKG